VIPSAIIENGTIKPILYAQPVTIGGVDYPANIFDLWSAAELASIGIHPLIHASSPLPYHIAGTPTYKKVGNEVIESRIDTEMLLADIKAMRISEIDMQFEMDAATLVEGYPSAERESWGVQEAESNALLLDPNAATPMLTGLAMANITTVDAVAGKVRANAVAFKTSSSALIGNRQARVRAITLATTLAEVLAV